MEGAAPRHPNRVDNIDTSGIRTTAASELFKDRVPSTDAEVVKRLKNAGAILLGKTNLHEFAYGGSSSVSFFGPVHNPWALDRVPGGSSGGSAAATAAGLCFGSLGTDTAGSLRIPASYCGIVGFKPTYGRVSNRGVVPLSWTLDHVGPLCRTVEDAAIMLGVIAGYDELDPSTAAVPVADYSSGCMELGCSDPEELDYKVSSNGGGTRQVTRARNCGKRLPPTVSMTSYSLSFLFGTSG